MSAAPQAPAPQQASTAWTEPPWSGWIETTGDALLILEAARRGLIPRVTRRLVDAERKMITSGSVFVFDEDESGIKRWTDGLFWSPSRILGNFLLYRETVKRGHRGARTDPDDSPELKPDGTLSRPKTEIATIGIDKHRERTLLGSLTNSYKFKPDGLMKKTFSLTIGGVAQHLISYYKIEDVENGRLRTPSSLPELAVLEISAEYLDKTHFRNPPKVEIGANGSVRYTGEGDDLDPPPSASSSTTRNPPASNLPLLTDGHVAEPSPSAKRPQKRFLPYTSTDRGRKKPSSQPATPEASSSAAPVPAAEASPGSIVLSPPQGSTSTHAVSAPTTPLYPPDTLPVSTTSSYPPQYGYFPASHVPPMAYPPHIGGAMYSQPTYPPSAPQPVMGNMNPQQGMPQYGYHGYQTVPQRAPDSSSSAPPGQAPAPQPYYSYYPHPPHPAYPPYGPGIPGPWPSYPSMPYAPQQQHQTHPPTQLSPPDPRQDVSSNPSSEQK